MEELFKMNKIDFSIHHFPKIFDFFQDLFGIRFPLKDGKVRHLNLTRFFQKNSNNKFRMYHEVVHFRINPIAG